MSKTAKNRQNSTWTPLNNEDLNQKIFNERRALVGKWFDKWTDAQRLAVLEDLVSKCKVRQLEHVNIAINRRKPVLHDDFTRVMPRVLSLYVFSFLDPRSLCRCSQVSWHWKYLTELDQMWMMKCLRLGWMLTFTPSPYESGMWKRLYIENIVALKRSMPATSKKMNLKDLEKFALSTTADGQSGAGTARSRLGLGYGKKPPWKGSDPVPRDTWRNNYLENDDEIEKVNKLRKRGAYGAEAEEIQRRSRNKVNTGLLQHSRRSNSLTRSKSAILLSDSPMPGDRPSWAQPVPANVAPFVHPASAGDLDPRAATIPPPSRQDHSQRSARAKTVTIQRSARDPPSSDLFPSQPWKVPTDKDGYDSDVY